MSLKDKLTEEMKRALKEKEKIRLSTIRLLVDHINKKEIEQGRKELDDDGIFKVISAMIRKGEEAVEQFKLGGRQDLVDQEKEQLEILKGFLPEQLSREEIQSLIDEAVQEAEAIDLRDLGKVMKILMPKLSGKADGKTVNEMVRERLSG
ncbi:MAG: GatB/YqeY domain-containing protein [Proteobacteria bacterium]|nr:GatB/YqeY domain-containing protein [Pseudomonadota bacterium]